MSITSDERDFILKMFKPNEVTKENVGRYLDEDVYNLLKNRDNLSTVCDRIVFVNKNKYRPYDSVTITKYLEPDFNCAKKIEDLFGYLTPPYLAFIDFHFLFECKSDESDEKTLPSLKFQTASKASAINTNVKITNNVDYQALISEFENQTHADLLTSVFRHHVDLYEYQNSGLKPYQLLSLVVHIQKFPQL